MNVHEMLVPLSAFTTFPSPFFAFFWFCFFVVRIKLRVWTHEFNQWPFFIAQGVLGCIFLLVKPHTPHSICKTLLLLYLDPAEKLCASFSALYQYHCILSVQWKILSYIILHIFHDCRCKFCNNFFEISLKTLNFYEHSLHCQQSQLVHLR